MPDLIAFRSVVQPMDCDFLGHMNVSRYFSACSDSVFALQAEMGLTAEDMRSGRQLSFAVVHADSAFHAELIAGDAVHMTAQVLELGTRSMTFRLALYRSADARLAFETRFKCVMLSIQDRKSRPVPDEVRAAAECLMPEEDGEPG